MGFALANVEARTSSPAPDNWLCGANRSSPSLVTSPQRPDAPPINVRNLEFRFHPLHGLSEPSTGRVQFGQSPNERDHWFISQKGCFTASSRDDLFRGLVCAGEGAGNLVHATA